MIKEIKIICDSYAFGEINDSKTRNKIRNIISSSLNIIRTEIICDERNNTPETIDKNELHIEIEGVDYCYGKRKNVSCLH